MEEVHQQAKEQAASLRCYLAVSELAAYALADAGSHRLVL